MFSEAWTILHTFVAARQPERCQTPYDPKHILRQYRADFALRRIWPMQCNSRTRSCHNLLFFRPSELAEYRLRYGGGRLYGQAVHEHARGGGHDG